MSNNFIKIGQGINNWKRFTWSFIITVSSLFLGSFLYFYALEWWAEKDRNPNTYVDSAEMSAVNMPLPDFVLSHISYIAWIFGLALSIRLIHKRPFKTLITADNHIKWRKVGWGFSLYFLLVAGTTLVDFLINPEDYVLNSFALSDYIKLFSFVLILTPIQTTTEEVFFRGFLMQWFGRKVTSPLLLSVIVGLIFGSLHFSNPEMEYSAVFVGADYVLSGILWCYITARTNSAELTIGAHAANNMFLGWFLTMDSTVFGNLPSLFVVKNIDPKISLIWTIFTLSCFSFLAIRKFGQKKTPPFKAGRGMSING